MPASSSEGGFQVDGNRFRFALERTTLNSVYRADRRIDHHRGAGLLQYIAVTLGRRIPGFDGT